MANISMTQCTLLNIFALTVVIELFETLGTHTLAIGHMLVSQASLLL